MIRELQQELVEIHNRVKNDAVTFWPAFDLVAFAFYDEQDVIVFNHPNVMDLYSIFPKSEDFNGADTLILYEDYPTAIVNIKFHDRLEDIYAIVIHELFHGLQYLREEKRFPNELLGVNYPILEGNIELRNQERKLLYSSVMASSKETKRHRLMDFFLLREQRGRLIGEFLDYETHIETVEGPAWYVEMRAFTNISPIGRANGLEKYCENLLNIQDSTLHLRSSCYSSGMAMCLLLDDFSPGWQSTFFDQELTLDEYLKQQIEFEYERPIVDMSVSKESRMLVTDLKLIREKIVRDFSKKNGYHVFIEGNLILKGFDPMNMVKHENLLLHKRFVVVEINGIIYQLQMPAITYLAGEGMSKTTKLHLVVDEKPLIMEDESIYVGGVGEFSGHYCEKNSQHFITV